MTSYVASAMAVTIAGPASDGTPHTRDELGCKFKHIPRGSRRIDRG